MYEWGVCVWSVYMSLLGKHFKLIGPGGIEQQLTSLGLLDLADEIVSSIWCQCFGFFWVGIHVSAVVNYPSGLGHLCEQCCKLLMLGPGRFIIFQNNKLQNQHLASNGGSRTYCLRTPHKPGHFLYLFPLWSLHTLNLGMSASSLYYLDIHGAVIYEFIWLNAVCSQYFLAANCSTSLAVTLKIRDFIFSPQFPIFLPFSTGVP